MIIRCVVTILAKMWRHSSDRNRTGPQPSKMLSRRACDVLRVLMTPLLWRIQWWRPPQISARLSRTLQLSSPTHVTYITTPGNQRPKSQRCHQSFAMVINYVTRRCKEISGWRNSQHHLSPTILLLSPTKSVFVQTSNKCKQTHNRWFRTPGCFFFTFIYLRVYSVSACKGKNPVECALSKLIKCFSVLTLSHPTVFLTNDNLRHTWFGPTEWFARQFELN